MVAVAGCKRTKDTFTSRAYHRMVSQFNPLFNGEQALLKGERDLAAMHQDNFGEILPVFKLGHKDQVSNIKPAMDKAIEKASKVIREHSMMIRNEQKNTFVDDSYMLIGKARFYKREYLEALETFNYVIQEFPESKMYEEARLWAARTETALGNYITAKDKFEKIYRSEDLPKKVKGDAFAAYAQLEIDQKRYTPAYQLLSQAIKRTRDKEKEVRWLFIMGQLQAKTGAEQEASETFKKVIKKGPPYELLFQAQLNRARNYDVYLNGPEEVYDDLRKMLKDDKNYDNRDQIYYVMAEIAEKLEEFDQMEDYLKQSVRASTTNQEQKALSYLKLGQYNFENKHYPPAAAYYDSSFSNLPQNHPRYSEIQKKKESLDELIVNYNTIELQDSLQLLASYSEKKRLEKIDAIIAQKKAEEEAKKQEEENPFNSAGSTQNSFAQNQQGNVKAGTWYFYNQRLRAAGITEFTNRFGNRKLEDNWRRKDKQSINSFESNTATTEGNTDGEGSAEASKSQEEERQQYLKNIPATEEELLSSDQEIINAYMKIGIIYKEDFKDYMTAEKELKALLERYPDLDIKGRVWYTLYRVNILDKDTKDAEYYKNLIKTNLPNSEFAALVDGETPAGEQDATASFKFYKKTYSAYQNAVYKRSLTMADSGLVAFGSTEQGPRFLMVKAFSQGQLGQQDGMKETLNLVLAKHPNTDQSKKAQSILDRLAGPEQGDDANAGTGADDGPQKPGGVKNTVENGKSRYSEGQQGEGHKYLLALPNIKGLVNNVNIALTDFNQKFFKNLQLNAKAYYVSAEKQMILVSGFPNEKKAMQYMDVLNQQKFTEKNLGGQKFQHFVISNSNFSKFYQDKDFEGYEKYFQDNYVNN